MKKCIFLSPVILVCLALYVSNVAGQKKQILFDFRQPQTSATAKIATQTQKLVLSKVFRKYLTDENKCNQNFAGDGRNDFLQAARNAGQIVPSIVDSAEGSFTARNKQETLYVISVGECNASHADNYGSKRVAIFAGQQLIADLDVNFLSNVVRTTDLDGDGVNELLMTTGDMAQGTLIEMASLLDFASGKLRAIEDFGTVVEDSCASLMAGSSSKASVITLTGGAPGKFPQIRVENYEGGCRKTKRWRFVSSGKMQ